MAWPFGLFQKKAPDRKPSDQPGSPIGVWEGKRQVITYKEAVEAEVALRHPIVYRCLVKIAAACASVDFYCEEDSNVPVNERAGSRTIKAINELLQSPNDYFTRNQLLYWMALNFAAYGRIPFKVGLKAVAPFDPNGIYPLTTRFFQSKRDGRGLVTGYGYSTAGNGTEQENWPTRAKASQGQSYAYEIVRPNMDGTFESKNNVHPLNAIGLPAQVVTLLLQRAADTASGHPNTKYILSADRTLTKQQKAELKTVVDDTKPESEESGNVLIFYNTAIKVDKLDNDLSDIHSKMPLDDMARQIVGAFGIPIALIGLGAADGAKFASNYQESRLSFWQDTMIPEYLSPFATGLTAALCPPGCRIVPDLDGIEAIAEARVARAEKLSKVTHLTIREKRIMSGFPPEPEADDKSGYAAPSPVAQPTTPPPTQDETR